MDAYLAIASRRDERRYRPDPLPDDVVERILDAGRLSGSASNRQPWTFVVPSSPARLERTRGTVFEPGNIHGAGLSSRSSCREGARAFDAGRAAQNMLLAAWNEGVSSCPNGLGDAEGPHAALELADDEDVAIVLSFGLPEKPRDVAARSAEEWSARANRKPLAELVRRLD